MQATPFQISIPDSELDALAQRLRHTRWPDQYAGDAWALGADIAWLRELIHYWATTFDWRATEQRLNQQPQFIARINGLRVHYVHRRGNGPQPYPLILTHGWPGSFIEFLPLIDLLCDPASTGGDPADAFDVVVPSLPGFGFSERPAEPGIAAAQTADMWAELMRCLGYAHFGAQGGDFGAFVSAELARRHPQQVDGVHLNYLPGSYEPSLDASAPPLTDDERAFLDAKNAWAALEAGYSHVHATKPQTAAYALNDSPTGLAAWIVEKFRSWSDCDGDIERVFSKDELLTNLSLYWHTQTISSSMRFYWENRLQPLRFAAGERVKPPLGFARFPKEISRPPQSWVGRVFDIAQWSDMPRGGHFAALEQPALLAEEIRRFFRGLRQR